MNWQQICDDPALQDLPFKIELNEVGQIVMTPVDNNRGRLQARLGALIMRHAPGGEVIAECSVVTEKGVKVPDVAWISSSFLARHGYSTPYPEAPEICVEVASPSNSSRQLAKKRSLYFASGAQEVWICDAFGNLEFHTAAGEIETSALIPDFPDNI